MFLVRYELNIYILLEEIQSVNGSSFKAAVVMSDVMLQ
jgi:hypothetical protein